MQNTVRPGVLWTLEHPLQADISYSSPEGPVRDQSGDEESGRIQDLLKDLVQIQEEQVEDPHQIEEQDIDEVLLEDHQVEDFTSSVLASISFWSLRVQIFESSLVTVRFPAADKGTPCCPAD